MKIPRIAGRILVRWLALAALSAFGLIGQSVFGQTGTWTTGASMPNPAYGLSAKFVNGKFYAIAGYISHDLRIYDPATNQWSLGTPLPISGLLHFFGCAVVGTKIYVIGGDTGGSGSRDTNYEYDTTNNSWATKAALPGGPRWNLAAATLNGKIYAIGGYDTVRQSTRVDIYDPSNNTWSVGTPLPTARAGLVAEAISGKIYVAAGGDSTGSLSSALVFDPNNPGSWNSIASTPITGGYLGQSTVLGGKFFIVGCGSGSPATDNMVEVYDPVSNTWSTNYSLVPTSHGGDGGAAADEASGKIYFTGGYVSGRGFVGELDILSIAPTATPSPTPTPTPTPGTTPTNSFGKLLNISTRLRVLGGDNVLIGGFIVTGSEPKKVIIRGIGPSLADFGLQGALADPTLELHDGTGSLIFSNDNWKDTQKQQILDTTIPPANDLESAIVATLAPGAYTAIVRGKNNGTGVAVVEAYDLNQAAGSKLANISTRGFVDTDNNVMIGGLIVGPTGTAGSTLLVRALGPSLSNFGIQNPLADPMLELHNGNGTAIASNDNWRDTQQANIQFAGIPPSNDLESAIVQTLAPGAYTAIVRGKNNGTGVGLIEVYDLTPNILEQVSQVISASQGGAITLPSGSSVSIPAGVLATDQSVTLSVLSSLPKQPPNGFIVGVGPALSISFAPVATSAVSPRSQPGPNSQTDTSSASLLFVLNFLGSTATGLDGAAPIGEYIRVNGSVDNWMGPAGQIDPVNKKVSFTVDPKVFLNAYASNISDFRFIFGLGNVNPNLPGVVLPRQRYWNGSSWVDTPVPSILLYTGAPPSSDPKTLVFVHGVNSFVAEAFGDCGAGSFDATSQIMKAGGYTQAIGLDYDWTKHLDVSGQQLAAFLRATGLKHFDLEGHSMGGAVVLSGASYITEPALQIDKIVTLGGAGEGTPVAALAPAIATFLLVSPATQALALVSGQTPTLVNLITSQGIQDLNLNSSALLAIRDRYNGTATRQSTTILTVAGTVPILGSEIFKPLFPSEEYDGLIGQLEADLTGRNHTLVGDYSVNHIELECSDQIIGDVGARVKPSPTPIPKLDFSATEGGPSPQNQIFTIKNAGPAGSILKYSVSADAPWLGLPDSAIPLAAGASSTRTVSANSSGLSAALSPYRATITVSDPASSNRSQTIAVSLTINPQSTGDLSLAITSQTWTPTYYNGSIVSYSAVVTGTASGPIGAAMGVTSFDGVITHLVTGSWGPSTTPGDGNTNERRPGDPATTTWTITESFAGTDEVLSISVGYAYATPSIIYVYAHP